MICKPPSQYMIPAHAAWSSSYNVEPFKNQCARGVQSFWEGDAYLPLKWAVCEGIFPNWEYLVWGNFPNEGWEIQGNSLTKVLQQCILSLDAHNGHTISNMMYVISSFHAVLDNFSLTKVLFWGKIFPNEGSKPGECSPSEEVMHICR